MHSSSRHIEGPVLAALEGRGVFIGVPKEVPLPADANPVVSVGGGVGGANGPHGPPGPGSPDRTGSG